MSKEMQFDDVPIEQLPLVTVLICNYNYEEYLPHAINSALNQSYKKLGIVIVDDCSTDGSWDMMYKTYFKDIPHENGEEEHYKFKIGKINGIGVFAIQLKQNVGPSEARNVGIKLTISETQAYQILDADDEMHPEKVKRLAACMMQSSQIGVVYADTDIINTETLNVTRMYREPFSIKRLQQECIVHSGSLISSEALRNVHDDFGFYDRNMRTCEDYDLWVRISEKFMICHVAEPLTLVRVQPRNSTVTVDKSIWEQNWNRIRQKVQIRHGQRQQ
jgi:glycosyltransferase involved in cell wall biosynthesis